MKKHGQSVSAKWTHQFIEMYKLAWARIFDNGNTLPYVLTHVTKYLFYIFFYFIFENLLISALWRFWRVLGIPPASQSVSFSCIRQRDFLEMCQDASGLSPFPLPPWQHLPVCPSLPSLPSPDWANWCCSTGSTSSGISNKRFPVTATAHLVTLHTHLGNTPELSAHWATERGYRKHHPALVEQANTLIWEVTCAYFGTFKRENVCRFCTDCWCNGLKKTLRTRLSHLVVVFCGFNPERSRNVHDSACLRSRLCTV